MPEFIKEYTLNGTLAGSRENDTQVLTAFLLGEVDELPEDITSHGARTAKVELPIVNDSWIAALKDNTGDGTEQDISHIVDHLKKGALLPSHLAASEEILPESTSVELPVERAPETQGPNERVIYDAEERLGQIVSKNPTLQIVPPALVHSDSPPSPTDQALIHHLEGATVTPVVGKEIWVDPNTQNAAVNIRSFKIEEPTVLTLQRLGTMPLPITKALSIAD